MSLPTPRGRRKVGGVVAAGLALAFVMVFDVWWRGHTVGPSIRDRLGSAPYPVVAGRSEPLDCDEAAYAYIGEHLVEGEVMYRDLSENKPPLGYWLYGLAIAVGGPTEWTIRLMPIPPILATIGLVWWVGQRVRGPWAAAIASGLFALLSTDPYLYGNGANMEHFLNLFRVAGLASMVAGLSSPTPGRRRAWLVGAGMAVALASLVKQVAGAELLLFFVWIAFAGSVSSTGWKARGVDLATLAIGFAAPWAVAVAWLVGRGTGLDAWSDIVAYGSALATLKVPDPNAPPRWVRWVTGNADPLGRLPWPFGKTDYLVWWGAGSWPIWLASLPSMAWMVGARRASADRLVVAWTLVAFAEVAMPGLFWAHYYLLPTPGLALVLAVVLVDAARAVGSRRFGHVGAGLVAGSGLVAAAAWFGYVQVRDYLLVPAEALTVRYKGGGQWVVLRDLGRQLDDRSKVWQGRPGLYIWGWQSPLHFYGKLDSPTRHFFADPLLEDYASGHHRDDPRVRPRVERIIADLERRPPGLVLAARPPFAELRRFLEGRGYRRSSLPGLSTTSADGIGLWVDAEHYRAFEDFAPR